MSYLGPAGIFSTDNPVSDQMQIEAEQGSWDEDGLFDYGDDWPEEDVLYGCCPKCHWWDHTLFWVGDPEDLGRAKDRLRDAHRADNSGCDGELEFG